MEYKRSGSDILVRLDKGDKIKECLTELAKAEQIQTGFVSGIGAVDQVELSYFLPEEQKYQTKKFEGSFEVLSLKGTLSIFDKKPHQHLHIILGQEDYSTIGGHLEEARVNITLELDIKVLVNLGVKRETDPDLNIQALKFQDVE
ncbi:Predicted DNA-binding protein with PD1-like DNA-binding motif [Alloiococcus otitis]|uniref:PPC domain-containing protein n=1 Tax=Alloiococcus otitis ATCC 51267 TaxID=883081 RepID=K9E9Q9_9LACT|nr:PPC domain-containing DNA-binding protein [Alloiococcus otitis]EKU93939.1 hypothetical protein HMPREF9698_00535 [Alloiococcus otitis ATCC 51267]SUU81659.1 Predicted DNA-binding protein with PD1-like DNA-binding motif [Alloiococcus otitis]